MVAADELAALRAACPGWRSDVPAELLRFVRDLDHSLLPLARARDWPRIQQRIEDGLTEAVHLFPSFSGDLFAFAVGWLARIAEAVGDNPNAIACHRLRLRMRHPRDPWRSLNYIVLVELLQQQGELREALALASKGARYSKRTGQLQAGARLNNEAARIRDQLGQSSS